MSQKAFVLILQTINDGIKVVSAKVTHVKTKNLTRMVRFFLQKDQSVFFNGDPLIRKL